MNEHSAYEIASTRQIEAANPARSAFVGASAGSGKTKVLIDRVARLLLEDVAPQAILCVTYTKSAAGEMQSRLFDRLGQWCIADDDTLRQELASITAGDIGAFSPGELKRARSLFAKALETPGGLRIQTFHSFCARLLRRFPLEADIVPGFRELDEKNQQSLLERALERLGDRAIMFETEIATQLLAGGRPNPADKHNRIVPTALLSKRQKMTDFIHKAGGLDKACELLRKEIKAPEQEQNSLHTQIMQQMPHQQIKALLPSLKTGKITDQKTAQMLEFALSDAPAEQRYERYKTLAFTSSGNNSARNPYTKICATPLMEQLFGVKNVSPQGSEILRIREAENSLRLHLCYERSAACLRIGHFLNKSMNDDKKRLGALDFDDLIATTKHLLTQKSAAEWVLWKLDSGIADILVDEAQDTSAEQWDLLDALTEELFSGNSQSDRAKTLFVVGDTKQSIYSFQGAAPELFLRNNQKFHQKAQSANLDFCNYELNMSFRSTPEVLIFVDAVSQYSRHYDQDASSENIPESADLPKHIPFRDKSAGCVELWQPIAPPDAETNIQNATIAPTSSQGQSNPKAKLARRLAQWIDELLKSGETICDPNTRDKRPCHPGDIVILLNSRTSGMFDELLFSLQKQNLPVAGADQLALLDSAPVQDVLNLIRFVLCPDDDLVVAELLTGPFCRLKDAELFQLAHQRQTSLWQSLKSQAGHRQAVSFLQGLFAHAHKPPFEFLSAALRQPSGLEQILTCFGAPAREPVETLLGHALAAEGAAALSLQTFLAAVETGNEIIKRDSSEPGKEIRIMSIHAAKGSEAPIVILPETCFAPKLGNIQLAWSQNGAPIRLGSKSEDSSFAQELRQGEEQRILDEHQRLLYVALTRARDRLLICGPWTGGAKSKTGYADKSWMANCLATMEALVREGAAEEYQPGCFRLGSLPEAQPLAASSQSTARPDWFYAALPATPPGERSPSDSTPSAPTLSNQQSINRRKGIIIHEILAKLEHDSANEETISKYLASYKDLPASEAGNILRSLKKLLDDPDCARILALPARREVPIIGRVKNAAGKDVNLNKRLDRLIIDDQTIMVLEIKTGAHDPDKIPEHINRQIADYVQLVGAAFPDREVSAAILWTDKPQLRKLTPEELAKLVLVAQA